MRVTAPYSYDRLGGDKYRVRLVDENGVTLLEGPVFTHPGPWGELSRRIEAEAERLLAERA